MNSDNSQPYKIAIGVVLIGLVAYFGYQITHQPRKLGIAVSELSYGTQNSSVTNTTATCGGNAPATTLAATSSARTSFIVGTTANAFVTICKAASCTAGASGILINSSSSPRFEQTDGYVGIYTCAAAASTTVGTSVSQ